MFNTLYPLLHVRDVAATSRFYQEHFGFEPVFESDWYVQLRGGATGNELAVIAFDHETIPPQGRHPTANLILSFEVEDAAADAGRLEQAGVSIVRCATRCSASAISSPPIPMASCSMSSRPSNPTRTGSPHRVDHPCAGGPITIALG